MNDPFEKSAGNRVEADDATVETAEGLNMFLLRTFHVYHVGRRCGKTSSACKLERSEIIVQKVGECKVTSLSSSVLIDSTGYKASFFDGIFQILRTRYGTLLCVAFFEGFFREVWLRRISGIRRILMLNFEVVFRMSVGFPLALRGPQLISYLSLSVVHVSSLGQRPYTTSGIALS